METHLDARLTPYFNKLQMAGVAIVATVASSIIALGELSFKGSVGLAALSVATVLFLVPFVAKKFALKRQTALSLLINPVNEEEARNEDFALANQLRAFKENAAADRTSQLAHIAKLRESCSPRNKSKSNRPTPQDVTRYQAQIQEIEASLEATSAVIATAETQLIDFQRLSKTLFAMNRAAQAITSIPSLERNATEMQGVIQSRNALYLRIQVTLAPPFERDFS